MVTNRLRNIIFWKIFWITEEYTDINSYLKELNKVRTFNAEECKGVGNFIKRINSPKMSINIIVIYSGNNVKSVLDKTPIEKIHALF